MGLKVEDPQPPDGDGDGHGHGHGANPTSSGSGQDLSSSSSIPRLSSCSTDRDSAGLSFCRVCHCVEPDLRGDSALAFLGILPPPSSPDEDAHHGPTATKDHAPASNNVLEFVSPHGEIFVCTTTTTDLESGPFHHHDHLMDLGCSCKNDLALAHYACALKWFITHGSTVCEICGNVAVNVRPVDFNKVLASLKEYEALRERTSTGDLSYLHYGADSGVDPDAVAAIRRQRLCEISSWFNPQNSHLAISQGQTEQTPATPSNNSIEHGAVVARVVHARWSLEGTGVFLAIGLGVIVLAWLVAPHVGKKAAVICLHMLLGGLCALTIIISLRFVFPRIQYGSMRCWAILFVFWFLVFGVWASRTHSIRSS